MSTLTAEQFANARAALLIGVDDYRSYACSMGLPPHGCDLAGAVADTARWARVVRHLRFVPGKTEVVVAPRRPPGRPLGGGSADVMAAYDRFLDRVPQGDLPPSLVVLSGRGATCSRRGLLFCPADTHGPKLEHAIPLTTFFERAQERIGDRSLIFVFDLGFVEGEPDVPWAQARNLPLGGDVPDEAPFGRLVDLHLLAGARSRPVMERRFGGRVHGVFSWALTTSLRQAALDGPDGVSGLSWGEGLGRSVGVLEALAIPQTPVKQGSMDASFNRAMVDPTNPSVVHVAMQLHAGTMGIMTDADPGVIIGYVTVDPIQTTETWSWAPGQSWPQSFRLVDLANTPSIPGSYTTEVQPYRRFNLNIDPLTSLPVVVWVGKTYTITRVTTTSLTMPAGWMRVRTDVISRPQFWYQYATTEMDIGVAVDGSDHTHTYLRFSQDGGAPAGPVFQTG